MRQLHFHLGFIAASAILLVGCGQAPDQASSPTARNEETNPVKKPAAASDKVPPKRVSNRPQNQNGVVFIAEYHHIREGKSTMERSGALFERDLERLYKLGFRPINVTEYLSGNFNLPPGASPVILTFDDANPSQIQLLDDGSVDPNSGFGILQKFSAAHPGFPAKAVFFVLPELWGQPSFRAKKIEIIQASGGEIANHTMTHPNLSKLSDAAAQKELSEPFKLLSEYKGNPEYLALPLGISPKNKSLLKGFPWQGRQIEFKAVFLVGANPAPAPGSENFNPLRIPRIQACEGDYGLDFWLDKLENGKVKPYVAP
jgi:peptidoglycan/xylan/chitin deacetylase (PgdA/CDA1 family)